MPNPRLSREAATQAVAAVDAAIRGGFAGSSAITDAATRLGLDRGTFLSRLRAAKRWHGMEPSAEPPPVTPASIERKPARIHTIVRAHSRPDAPVYRILAIGDAHDSPALPDKSRFRWMGRYAADIRPDYIVQIGDMFTFDSLSRHDPPGSLNQKLRPSFARDLESGEEALAAFAKDAPGDVQKHITLGNHDVRPLRYEAGQAEIEGQLWGPVQDLLARYNWRPHDEGAYFFIGGVAWLHSPRTIMNREYAGKTLNAIANDSVVSTVKGHSHRGQLVHAPKLGPAGGVTIVDLGTCLPTGYVAQYAKVAMTAWTYGVWLITVSGGQIVGYHFTSMDELASRYA